jgi:hypothetical protein
MKRVYHGIDSVLVRALTYGTPGLVLTTEKRSPKSPSKCGTLFRKGTSLS